MSLERIWVDARQVWIQKMVYARLSSISSDKRSGSYSLAIAQSCSADMM